MQGEQGEHTPSRHHDVAVQTTDSSFMTTRSHVVTPGIFPGVPTMPPFIKSWKNAKCNRCKGIGHIARVCPSVSHHREHIDPAESVHHDSGIIH
ncbi:hypothetical protein B0H19DRAFT_433252 [Mycena capillaripes]|nr:hypothetical protein B0H19DRAFT_433252 [Mycena capillaripes]